MAAQNSKTYTTMIKLRRFGGEQNCDYPIAEAEAKHYTGSPKKLAQV